MTTSRRTARRKPRKATAGPQNLADMPQISWLSVNLHNGSLIMKCVEPLMRDYGRTTFENMTSFASMVVGRRDSHEIIFVQDARQYDRAGNELLHFLERLLPSDGIGIYRGFLTPGRWSPHHQLVLIRTDRVPAAHHWRGEDPHEATGLYGYVELVIDGDETRPVWVISMHYEPHDDARVARSRRLHAPVTHEHHRAIAAGGFNPGESADSRAVDYLTTHGWIDHHARNGSTGSTERCLTFGGLAPVPGSTWVSKYPTAYSHHRQLGGRLVIVRDNHVSAT